MITKPNNDQVKEFIGKFFITNMAEFYAKRIKNFPGRWLLQMMKLFFFLLGNKCFSQKIEFFYDSNFFMTQPNNLISVFV